MKKIILLLLVLILYGCKKEPRVAAFELFLSFERDGEMHHYEGTELTFNPGFRSIVEEDPINKFTFQSYCGFKANTNFTIDFIQYDTSNIISQEGIERLFSEGVKEIEYPNFSIIPTDSIVHRMNIKLIENTDTSRTTYSSVYLSEFDQNYFEITNTEKIIECGLIRYIVIEADFDLELPSIDEKKIHLQNGKLRYHYWIQ